MIWEIKLQKLQQLKHTMWVVVALWQVKLPEEILMGGGEVLFMFLNVFQVQLSSEIPFLDSSTYLGTLLRLGTLPSNLLAKVIST